MKIYSDNVNIQDCYVKTIKRLEYHLKKDGKDKVLERINKNYYWLQYKKPYENDTYYNSIRSFITESEAYAAIQQAQIDFASVSEEVESKELSKEDERKLLRKEWMQWVGAGWSQVISRRMPITTFNNLGIEFMGKVRKLGDLEAWGYNMYGDDLRACLKFAFDRFCKVVFKWIDNPGPNVTRWTFDENTADIYCLDKLYVSGDELEPYLNIDNEFIKQFEKKAPCVASTTVQPGTYDACFLPDDEDLPF